MVCNYREMFKFYFSNFNTHLAYSRFRKMTQKMTQMHPRISSQSTMGCSSFDTKNPLHWLFAPPDYTVTTQ
jgi:hypothetical protein